MGNSKILLLPVFSLLIMIMPVLQASTMVIIPASPFQTGCPIDDPSCTATEGPRNDTTVFVPTFQIDTHEVTVRNYLGCLKVGKCTRPIDHARNQNCNFGAENRLDHPVNCVDSQQAADYCDFVGKRLPNEIEWEKAARGKITRHEPGQEKANCQPAALDDKTTSGTGNIEDDSCGQNSTRPVGSRSPNTFNLFDMLDNAAEWTSAWYSKDILKRYEKANLAGQKNDAQQVVRGDSWNKEPAVSGDAVDSAIGFRCAR